MINKVGNTTVQRKHKASCHCGAVELELTLVNGLENPGRCDCSICRRKGTISASVKLDGLLVVKGQNVLKCYQFNTRTAKHYFCPNCGIHTHHQRRSDPTEYGFNVGCLEGINLFDLAKVVTHDGVNHPADHST